MTSPGLPRGGRDGFQAGRASRHPRAQEHEHHEGDHHDRGDEALAPQDPLVRLDLVLVLGKIRFPGAGHGRGAHCTTVVSFGICHQEPLLLLLVGNDLDLQLDVEVVLLLGVRVGEPEGEEEDLLAEG